MISGQPDRGEPGTAAGSLDAFLSGLTSDGGMTARGSVLDELDKFGSNPGNLRAFTHMPDDRSTNIPLVVVLHGCNQSAAGYYERSGWAKYADEAGFALLFSEQQVGLGPVLPSFPGLVSVDTRNHQTRCFNFAELRDSQRAR